MTCCICFILYFVSSPAERVISPIEPLVRIEIIKLSRKKASRICQ